MSEHQSLFHREGDRFVPSPAAGSPWGELTGGGPVAGLLSRAVEQQLPGADGAFHVARVTFDLMRPIPHVPLEVRSRTVRDGKRLQVIETALLSDGVEMARATAQALRRVDLGQPVARTAPGYPLPETLEPGTLLPAAAGSLRWGVQDVTDVRWVSDHFGGSPSRVWLRMPLSLVPGERMSPLVHTAVLADCVNGAAPLSKPYGPFINSDISLSLHGELTGDWLGMEVERDVHSTGVGVVHAVLSDAGGSIGHVTESVLANQLG